MLIDLETELIKLRALEPSDDHVLLQWENDTRIWQHGTTLLPFSMEEIRSYIASVKDIFADRQLRLIIEDKTSKNAVGMVDLFEFEPIHQRASVGILIDEQHRQKGFAREALELICAYAKDQLGLHQLHCAIRSGNTQSVELFGRCGFEKIAELPDWLRKGSGWENQLILQKILE